MPRVSTRSFIVQLKLQSFIQAKTRDPVIALTALKNNTHTSMAIWDWFETEVFAVFKKTPLLKLLPFTVNNFHQYRQRARNFSSTHLFGIIAFSPRCYTTNLMLQLPVGHMLLVPVTSGDAKTLQIKQDKFSVSSPRAQKIVSQTAAVEWWSINGKATNIDSIGLSPSMHIWAVKGQVVQVRECFPFNWKCKQFSCNTRSLINQNNMFIITADGPTICEPMAIFWVLYGLTIDTWLHWSRQERSMNNTKSHLKVYYWFPYQVKRHCSSGYLTSQHVRPPVVMATMTSQSTANSEHKGKQTDERQHEILAVMDATDAV